MTILAEQKVVTTKKYANAAMEQTVCFHQFF